MESHLKLVAFSGKRKKITMILSEVLVKRIKDVAKKYNTSMVAIVEVATTQYLDSLE